MRLGTQSAAIGVSCGGTDGGSTGETRHRVDAGRKGGGENRDDCRVCLLFSSQNHSHSLIDRLLVALGYQPATGGQGTARSANAGDRGSQGCIGHPRDNVSQTRLCGRWQQLGQRRGPGGGPLRPPRTAAHGRPRRRCRRSQWPRPSTGATMATTVGTSATCHTFLIHYCLAEQF